MRNKTNPQDSPGTYLHDGLQILARIIVDVASKKTQDSDPEPVAIQIVKTHRHQGGDAA